MYIFQLRVFFSSGQFQIETEIISSIVLKKIEIDVAMLKKLKNLISRFDFLH